MQTYSHVVFFIELEGSTTDKNQFLQSKKKKKKGITTAPHVSYFHSIVPHYRLFCKCICLVSCFIRLIKIFAQLENSEALYHYSPVQRDMKPRNLHRFLPIKVAQQHTDQLDQVYASCIKSKINLSLCLIKELSMKSFAYVDTQVGPTVSLLISKICQKYLYYLRNLQKLFWTRSSLFNSQPTTL